MAGIGTSGMGPDGSSRFGSNQGDGRNNSFRYPSPWFDVAQMDLPRSVKSLFRWCRYHMLVNPLVSSVVRKMSAYPITDLVISDEPEKGFDQGVKKWKDCLFRQLNIPAFQLEIGLDYHGYGNCVVSLLYPFHKYLQCRACGYQERIKRLRMGKDWDFKNMKFELTCPRCEHEGVAKAVDRYYQSYRDIKLVRWNPTDLDIDFNPITRKTEYAYTIPAKVRAKVLARNRHYLEDMPQSLLDAVRTNRPFILTPENVFHFKAPTPSLDANDEGWGYPPILPALKDSFYLQIMKKAQEAVMLEHLVPLDIFFPASPDASANPYLTINLSDWKSRVEAEIIKWRGDPNHKPVLPVPIGHQRVGGNGRALMLTQEIRAWSEHIVAGMGVPQEFVFGGLSYSGTSVSLRMLENQFITYRTMHEHFLQHFLIPNIARFMGWNEISVQMKAFKMADDMQNRQLMMSLSQMRKISDKTLLAEFGKDAFDEAQMVEQELRRTLEITKLDTLYKAQIQGEQQQVLSKYQIKTQEAQATAQMKLQAKMQAQQVPGVAPAPGGEEATPGSGPAGPDAAQLAEGYASRLQRMDPAQRTAILQQMRDQMPQLHDLVQQKLQQGAAESMQPLPEQRPPRRSDALV